MHVTSGIAGLTSGRAQPGPLTALLEYFTVLFEYLNRFQSQWQGTANIWEGLSPARLSLGYTTTCHILYSYKENFEQANLLNLWNLP